ncbi:MAG: tetratricopeptide repeat protein [Bacteroidetes bacterium]|nr:tetratricopeptide repeat protein [Bacteroidota bacterium]
MKNGTIHIACIFVFLLFSMSGTAQPAQKEYDTAKDAYYDGDYKKAEKLFQKVLDIREKELGHEDPQTLKALNRLAKTYGKLRQNEKSLELFKEVLALTKKTTGEESEETADCYQDIGNILSQAYEPEKANEAYLHALRIYEKKFGKESSEYGNVLMVIGLSYHKMAAYKDAERYYQQAFEIFKKTSPPDSEDFNRIYNNMGYLYRKIGDYEKALEYGQKALEIKLMNYDTMHPSVAKYYSNLGRAYEDMERYKEALPFLEKAAKISKVSLGENHPQTAGFYSELGDIYADLKDYKTALQIYQKGIRTMQKIMPEDHPYLIGGYFSIATVYGEQKKWDDALKYYRIALDKLVKRSYRPINLIADCYEDMSGIFYEKNQLDTALVYCQHGLREIAKNFNPDRYDFYKNPSPDDVQASLIFLKILAAKAKYLEARFKRNKSDEKDLVESLNTTLLTVQVIENMRRSYQSETSRQYLNSDVSEVYKRGVRLAIELYQKTNDADYLWQAFQLSEKSKASILWRSLNEGNALQNAHLPATEKEVTEKLAQQLANLEDEMDDAEEEGDETIASALQSQLFEIKLAYEEQLKKLEKLYPEFYQLRYAPPVVSKAILSKKLADGQIALVEYFYDEGHIYCFIFDEKGLHGKVLPMMQRLQETIEKLRAFNVSDVSNNASDAANRDYLLRLYQLYHELISPIKKDIANKSELVIVPHGVLNYLPFGMLCSESESANFANQTYLIKQYSIQYAWSAALWAKPSASSGKTTVPFAGFAPTYSSPIASATVAAYRSSLSELTYATQETQQANAFFHGRLFLNSQATESSFRSVAIGSRLLHLATHAFTDDEHPLQSGLVFSSENDTLADGFLHAYEIYNMHMPAELAVMSACNTGFGQLAEGEGVMSLGRAFFYAGCRSVVMSQWLANDQSTTKLMGYFYQHLSEGKPKDEALRQAKLDYLAHADPLTAHPYFWAGMVAVGDMRALPQDEFWWKWWILGGAILLAGGYLLINKMLKNQAAC